MRDAFGKQIALLLDVYVFIVPNYLVRDVLVWKNPKEYFVYLIWPFALFIGA